MRPFTRDRLVRSPEKGLKQRFEEQSWLKRAWHANRGVAAVDHAQTDLYRGERAWFGRRRSCVSAIVRGRQIRGSGQSMNRPE